MALVIKGSTSGQVTIDVPAEAGTRAINFPAVSGNILTDGAALPAIDGSALTGLSGGITQADMYRLTTNVTSDTGTVTNWERCDDASYGKIGTGITESSGLFSFPETGIYAVRCMAMINPTDDNDSVLWNSFVTNGDDSSNDLVAETVAGDPSTTVCSEFFVDVTSTANVKVKFGVGSLASGGFITGCSASNCTAVTFVRLGDT